MKKLKIVCFSLITIFLLFFGVFSFGVEVKANDYTSMWDAPESAKNFVDFDGKGIRLYFLEVQEEGGFFVYADMVAVKNYVFDDGELEAEGPDVIIGREFFDSDLIDGWISYYLDKYGDGNTIPEHDRTYVYFSVVEQCFMFEFHGRPMQYATYWIERCSLLYDEMGYDDYYNYGYDVGYYNGFSDGYIDGLDEGYDEGYYYGYYDGYETGYTDGISADESEAYERGYSDGQQSKLAENNAAFYQGIEKWLVPAIITVIALGGFVTIAARKRREE